MSIGRKQCSIAECDGNAHHSARGRGGMCGKHYQRMMKYGDPLATKTTPRGDPQRFYEDVVLAYEGDECVIWPYHRNNQGYGIVQRNGNLGVVSRLACEEENGPPPTSKHHAAHSCGNGMRGCVTKGHLSWKTPAENQADRLVHGTHNRGERAGASKLTESQVREIQSLKGIEPQKSIARRYGVARPTIASIHQGRTWSWLNNNARTQGEVA